MGKMCIKKRCKPPSAVFLYTSNQSGEIWHSLCPFQLPDKAWSRYFSGKGSSLANLTITSFNKLIFLPCLYARRTSFLNWAERRTYRLVIITFEAVCKQIRYIMTAFVYTWTNLHLLAFLKSGKAFWVSPAGTSQIKRKTTYMTCMINKYSNYL